MRKAFWATLIPGLLLIGLVSGQCQEAPKHPVEARGTFGWAGFVDENTLHHLVAGGSLRVYLTTRLSVEPELIYMRGPGFDRDLVFTPNVAFDFARSKRVRPYVIGGVGLLWHRDGFRTAPGRTTFFSGHEGTFGGGIGLKVLLTDRLFVSPEVRLGWEPFMRSTISVGYRF